MQTGSSDDPPNERTVGQMIEDDNIETKTTVNIRAAKVTDHGGHLVSGSLAHSRSVPGRALVSTVAVTGAAERATAAPY